MDQITYGQKIIEKLEFNEHKGYFVGGAVRDLLLNRKINDIDIATDAHPSKVMSIFSKSIPTGIKHGTVTVIEGGFSFEITTFRTEDEYLDFRRPSNVNFVSNLIEDLKRRDFTINAMAMAKDGEIIDPFGGRKSISQKEIVAVGDPVKRFREDPLRMLRAIRFVSQLNFTIEHSTWLGIIEKASYIENISPERIKDELDKIFVSPYTSQGINLLFKSNLLSWIEAFKGFNFSYISQNNTSQLLNEIDNPLLKLAIFLNNFPQEEHISILRKLRYSNKEIKAIKTLNRSVDSIKQRDSIFLKRCLVEANLEICKDASKLLNLLGSFDSNLTKSINSELERLDEEIQVRSISELAINGTDLIHLFNQPSGSWIKKILDFLFEQVVYHGLLNEKSTLIERAKAYYQRELNEYN